MSPAPKSLPFCYPSAMKNRFCPPCLHASRPLRRTRPHRASVCAQDWAKTILDKSPRHQECGSRSNTARAPSTHSSSIPKSATKRPSFSSSMKSSASRTGRAFHGRRHCGNGLHRRRARSALRLRSQRRRHQRLPTSQQSVIKAVSNLDPATVTADLNATADFHALKLPSASGKLAVIGFCWGGGQSLPLRHQSQGLSGAFVFYGPPPLDDSLDAITAPVHGFYAGSDARISSTVPQTQQLQWPSPAKSMTLSSTTVQTTASCAPATTHQHQPRQHHCPRESPPRLPSSSERHVAGCETVILS